jgi:leucyl-tRNA synthetase
MIFLNLAAKKGRVTSETAGAFIRILSPFAPHMAEELWELAGHTKTLAYEPWPEFDEEYLKEDTFNYPVSFNGKTRFNIELSAEMPEEEIIKNVLADGRARKWIGTSKPSKIIVVRNRIINIVLKN